jgi:hypothetical protein
MSRRPTRTRPIALVLAVGVGVAALSACGLGSKQEAADRIIAAAKATATSTPISGRADVVIVPELGQANLTTSVEVLRALSRPVAARFFVVAGASSWGPVAAQEFPTVRFDDRTIAVKRPDAAPDEARPWVQVRIDQLEKGSGRIETFDGLSPIGVLSVLDPRLLLDLAAGPLAGSVSVLDRQGTGPDEVVHTKANFDVLKVIDRTRRQAYTDDSRQSVELLLSLLRLTDSPHPGEIWIGADGRVRRFVVTLKGHLDKVQGYAMRVDLTIDQAAKAPDAGVPPTPAPQATVGVRSIVPMMSAARHVAGVTGA